MVQRHGQHAIHRPRTGARIETTAGTTWSGTRKHRPRTGARIETGGRCGRGRPAGIAPARGRGLKRSVETTHAHCHPVIAPARGRGLKRSATAIRRAPRVIAPARGRGLKQSELVSLLNRYSRIAPARGRGLKLCVPAWPHCCSPHRPRTGARIETRSIRSAAAGSSSPPHGGAD